MLQEYLNESLLQLTDDGHFEKLKKAADELSKKLQKSKSKIVSCTLVAIDPDVPIDNPDVLEVKEIILKHWNTFTANVKDTPLTYIRVVILEALSTISKDINIAFLIFLSGRNVIKYHNIVGPEKRVYEDFFKELGQRIGEEATKHWASDPIPNQTEILLPNIKLSKIAISGISQDELEKHFKAASIQKDLGSGGENPQYPSHNALPWPTFFSKRASEGLTQIINKSLKNQEEVLNSNQQSIQEGLNNFLKEINKILNAQVEKTQGKNVLQMKRAELLWWKESGYSASFDCSYRALSNGIKQMALSNDYAMLIPFVYPASVDYFLTETHHGLVNENKLKFSMFLAEIKDSTEQLRTIVADTNIESGRVTLLNFIRGVVWGKYQISQFENYIGISENADTTLAELTLWLFHDFQITKALNSK